uniref:Uncharacterized protein n=1 Tax=Nelumbo nucifera TaxID=4432 RepID=A0A822XRP1_NELNU|nr:TPA_asm: hypothetical protein HUJ06_023274 [Nelumbo nucifera]
MFILGFLELTEFLPQDVDLDKKPRKNSPQRPSYIKNFQMKNALLKDVSSVTCLKHPALEKGSVSDLVCLSSTVGGNSSKVT